MERKHVLITGSSRGIGRTSAVLFGDGAAGALLEANDDVEAFAGTDLKTFGDLGDRLIAGETNPIGEFPPAQFTTFHPFKMDGRAVYKFATTEVPNSIERVCDQNHVSPDEVDYFILHQANIRIIKSIAKKLKQPLTKFPNNMERYGNTSAASVPRKYSSYRFVSSRHKTIFRTSLRGLPFFVI